MRRDYDELFQLATKVDPDIGFEQGIMDSIHRIQKRRVAIKQGFYAILSFVSFFGGIASIIYALRALSSSGVYEYISLLFSDLETLSYFKEFALSVAESMPILNITLVFAILSLFTWSLLKIIKTHGNKEIYRSQVA